jgi:hypothetical protein
MTGWLPHPSADALDCDVDDPADMRIEGRRETICDQRPGHFSASWDEWPNLRREGSVYGSLMEGP